MSDAVRCAKAIEVANTLMGHTCENCAKFREAGYSKSYGICRGKSKYIKKKHTCVDFTGKAGGKE